MQTVVGLVLFVVCLPAIVIAQPCPPVDVNLSVAGESQQWWMVLLDFFVQLSAPLITAILGILGAFVVRKLTKKWDAEKQEALLRLVDGFVVSGVAFAEEQARKALKVDDRKTDGAEKMQRAVDYVERQLSSSGIRDIAHDEIIDLIESRLHMERTKPDGVVLSDNFIQINGFSEGNSNETIART